MADSAPMTRRGRTSSWLVLACYLALLTRGRQITAIPAGLSAALPLFDPSRSSSASVQMSLPLRVHYADANTELSGVVCRDDVRLGEYKGRIPFACWTNAPNEQFWARMGNGVLGLAPRYQKQHDEDKHPLPAPFLLALTAPTAKDSNAAGLPPKFSFMASKTAAELQLGGFVAGSVKGEMRTVQSLSAKSYSLSIASVRIGDDYDSAQELLTFDPTDEQHHVPALLDTGSPCLMLPDTQVPFRHTDARTCTHTCRCICTFVCIYMSVYMHACIHAYTHTLMHTCPALRRAASCCSHPTRSTRTFPGSGRKCSSQSTG